MAEMERSPSLWADFRHSYIYFAISMEYSHKRDPTWLRHEATRRPIPPDVLCYGNSFRGIGRERMTLPSKMVYTGQMEYNGSARGKKIVSEPRGFSVGICIWEVQGIHQR